MSLYPRPIMAVDLCSFASYIILYQFFLFLFLSHVLDSVSFLALHRKGASSALSLKSFYLNFILKWFELMYHYRSGCDLLSAVTYFLSSTVSLQCNTVTTWVMSLCSSSYCFLCYWSASSGDDWSTFLKWPEKKAKLSCPYFIVSKVTWRGGSTGLHQQHTHICVDIFVRTFIGTVHSLIPKPDRVFQQLSFQTDSDTCDTWGLE